MCIHGALFPHSSYFMNITNEFVTIAEHVTPSNLNLSTLYNNI